MILRGGANVYPAEVERVLLEHPAVAAGAVLGVPDERLGQRVAAVVEVAAGRQLDVERPAGLPARRPREVQGARARSRSSTRYPATPWGRSSARSCRACWPEDDRGRRLTRTFRRSRTGTGWGQRPFQTGGRFSRKARGPSAKSSVATMSRSPSSDRRHAASGPSSMAARSTRRLRCTASGAPAQTFRARATASSTTRSGSTTALTMPSRAAVVASIGQAGERHLHGHVAGDHGGEPHEAAGPGDQRPADLGQAEAGVGRRHHEVAREDDLEAAGVGGADHGGDQRLATLAAHEAGEAAPLGGDLVEAAALQRPQVGAGAERGRGAREDADPQRVVAFQAVDRRLEAVGGVGVDGVARLRPVDRDHRHVTSRLERDGHRSSLRAVAVRCTCRR